MFSQCFVLFSRAAASLRNLSTREWTTMKGRHCGGRFVPNTLLANSAMSLDGTAHETKAVHHKLPQARLKRLPKESFADFMRRRMIARQVDTEINIQLGDFTLKTAKLKVLSDAFISHPDFITIFGRDKYVQSAIVSSTEFREWVRLVGRRHDVQLWTATKRQLKFSGYREYPSAMHFSTEAWVKTLIDPVRTSALKDFTMYLPKENLSATAHAVTMMAVAKDGTGVKEVVLLKDHECVMVYNVVEFGRRYVIHVVLVAVVCTGHCCVYC